MKICYVVPGLMDEGEARRREALLRSWANPGTQVDIVLVDEGPPSIESAYEELICVKATAEKVMEMEAAGYDAAIIGCAGDPGMEGIREIATRILVTGPGEISFHAAALLGKRFGLLTLDEGMVAAAYDQAYRAGLRDRLASVAAGEIPVLELMENPAKTLERLVKACKQAIERDCVDVMVIGCMTMGFMSIAKKLETAIGIPVVNPADICLKFTEAMVACGLMHSKKAFMVPPKILAGKAKDYRDLYQKRV